MHIFKKIVFSLLICSSFTAPNFAQKKSSKEVAVKKTSEVIDATTKSLTYTLPKTSIKIEIETQKVIKKAGPYYRYSQRFLNLTSVITEDSEEWEIKGVKLTTFGSPDDEKRYSIFSSGNTSAPYINLTSTGILNGINNPIKDSSLQIRKNKKSSVPEMEEINFDNIPLHEELLYKTSTAAMAQEAANMIYKIRNNKIDLLSGEMENLPPDGEAYKTVLKELNKMEKQFVSLFAGKTITATQKYYFEITPSPLTGYDKHVVCRFSKQKGIVEAADITGTPVYFNLDVVKSIPLKNNTVEAPKNPANNGLYYSIPALADVSIYDRNNKLKSQTIELGQYGQVVSLPASIIEKEDIIIKICPVTGALISISNKE